MCRNLVYKKIKVTKKGIKKHFSFATGVASHMRRKRDAHNEPHGVAATPCLRCQGREESRLGALWPWTLHCHRKRERGMCKKCWLLRNFERFSKILRMSRRRATTKDPAPPKSIPTIWPRHSLWLNTMTRMDGEWRDLLFYFL